MASLPTTEQWVPLPAFHVQLTHNKVAQHGYCVAGTHRTHTCHAVMPTDALPFKLTFRALLQVFNGQLLSLLGFTFANTASVPNNYYLDTAFINS